MTTLTVFADSKPDTVVSQTQDAAEITRILKDAGVRFERWSTRDLPADASNEQILEAYAAEIALLKAERGFETADVVSLNPDHPDREMFRQKFLNEHRHSEDEVRFFVRGQGLFYLHVEGKVYAVLCRQNDLISVPDGTPHWFDMGPRPQFTCIRLFTNTEGWVAQFTGDGIAEKIPRYETLVEAVA
jgi:1,2-dihydroxy-3-keto-5-methylthiopentene dioxygenase